MDDALKLFEIRAQEVCPNYENSPNDPLLEELMQQLDFLPLAIEQSAHRMDALTPQQVLQRIDQFTLMPPMRDALDASWKRLTPWQQETLRQCSVFQDSFSIEAAEQVLDLSMYADAPSPVDAIHGVLRHSLFRTFNVPGVASSQEVRLRMLLALREYVSPSGCPEVRTRYTECVLTECEQWTRRARMGHHIPLAMCRYWMRDLLAIHNAAKAQPDETTTRTLLRGALCLQPLSNQLDEEDWRKLLDDALESPSEDDSDLRAQVHLARSVALLASDKPALESQRFWDDIFEARRLVEKRSNPEVLVRSYVHAVNRLLQEAQYAQAEGQVRLGLEIAEREAVAEGQLLHAFGLALAALGRPQEAIRVWEQGLWIAHNDGDRFSQAHIELCLAKEHIQTGALSLALPLLHAARQQFVVQADQKNEAIALMMLGSILHERGNLNEALEHYDESAVLLGEACCVELVALLLKRGLCYQTLGLQEQAVSDFRQAEATTRKGDTDSTCIEARLFLAEIEATNGDAVSATQRFASVEALVARGSAEQQALFTLCHAMMLVAQQDVSSAQEALESPSVLAGQGQQNRLAKTRLLKALEGASGIDLVVGPKEKWFSIGKTRADLSRRAAVRRIFQALIERHEKGHSEELGKAELIAIGWPGEDLLARAATGRLHTAIWTLRKMGLDEALSQQGTGYLLNASVRIRRAS
jgi:tetratricopeptide (TPR) repeat protein